MKPISIPPTYFYFCLSLTIALYFLTPQYNLIKFPYNLTGTILILLGLFLIYYSWFLFKKNNTTEKFEKSKTLVTENIYKYSRNPMYLGGILFLIGFSILFTNIISFISPLIFFLIIHFIFIPFEEEKNKKTFGKKFLKYKSKTRKWI